MRKKGVEKQPDCRAEREIIQFVSENSTRVTMVDSGFYPRAYCKDPVQFSQASIVYEMESIGESNTKKHKLAVVEFVSSTLPCPDRDDVKFRRFLIFDMESPNKPLLDIQGNFVVPEIGKYPYRIHFVNATKVLQSSFKIPPGKLPSAIELKDGKFSLSLASAAEKNDLKESPRENDNKSRVRLNSIYSKDQKHVYYETADESGQILGADPSTFQLLSAKDESAYTKENKKVFFFGKAIASADAKTFVQINERYGKDVNHVYHMESILADADVSSFVAPFQSVWYAMDKNHVFSGKKIFSSSNRFDQT